MNTIIYTEHVKVAMNFTSVIREGTEKTA